jgi:phosphoribosylformylglycinamidine synthase
VVVALLELLESGGGAQVELPDQEALFTEAPGRVLVETADASALQAQLGGRVEMSLIGYTTTDRQVTITAGGERVALDGPEQDAVRQRLADQLG